jgi:hypothetical protein
MFHVRTMPERTKSNPAPQYRWRRQVRDAILETDAENRLAKVVIAESAISMRLIQEVADGDEQLALQYALCDLKVLRRSCSPQRRRSMSSPKGPRM